MVPGPVGRQGRLVRSVQRAEQHLSQPAALHQTQFVAELEERHTLWDQPGKIKVLYWLSRGNLGTYSDALALGAATGTTPSTDAVANYRSKYGMGSTWNSRSPPTLACSSRPAGPRVAWRKTTSPTSTSPSSAGLSLAGTRWGRPDDTVGLAGASTRFRPW